MQKQDRQAKKQKQIRIPYGIIQYIINLMQFKVNQSNFQQAKSGTRVAVGTSHTRKSSITMGDRIEK